MNLYTEEEVKRAIYLAHCSTEDEVLAGLNPIELPSDEEINAKINSFPYTKHLDDGQYNEGIIEGFEMGVEWIEYYILTQVVNNEHSKLS